MRLHDCYDPVAQEERRQARWDRLVDKLPVCTLCKKTLHPGDVFHTAGCMPVCPSCVDELHQNIEILEEIR